MAMPAIENYYLSNQKQILREINFAIPHYQRLAAESYGQALADAVVKETMERFVALLPGIPYIGGKENRLTENLYLTAAMLAFHQELGTHGKTITETARIIYLGTDSLYRSFPYNFMLRWEGWRIFSQDHLNKIRQEAEISHARRYPGDWVFDYLPSDGKTYLYGVNYTECGIVKYLDQQGASELAPYLCWLDYPMCNAMHVGLIRTETIAQGFTKCNFRFCKWQSGAQVTPDFLKN